MNNQNFFDIDLYQVDHYQEVHRACNPVNRTIYRVGGEWLKVWDFSTHPHLLILADFRLKLVMCTLKYLEDDLILKIYSQDQRRGILMRDRGRSVKNSELNNLRHFVVQHIKRVYEVGKIIRQDYTHYVDNCGQLQRLPSHYVLSFEDYSPSNIACKHGVYNMIDWDNLGFYDPHEIIQTIQQKINWYSPQIKQAMNL